MPLEGMEAIWFVVSRAARLHAGPSVSSRITHFYPVGTELKLIGYEQGWFLVSDPATLRQGWIYERYYLQAIPGPGQTQLAVQDLPSPTRVALAAPEPKPVSRVKKPKTSTGKIRIQDFARKRVRQLGREGVSRVLTESACCLASTQSALKSSLKKARRAIRMLPSKASLCGSVMRSRIRGGNHGSKGSARPPTRLMRGRADIRKPVNDSDGGLRGFLHQR